MLELQLNIKLLSQVLLLKNKKSILSFSGRWPVAVSYVLYEQYLCTWHIKEIDLFEIWLAITSAQQP